MAVALPAELPPSLSELDPALSRLVTVPIDGEPDRTFHVLDTHPEGAKYTVLCVHGNPSWSYLWRNVIAQAPPGVRVIAPDHLNMGYSERTGNDRTLADRVADLTALTEVMGVTGPVVTVAHDWGGPISLGWALRHIKQLKGVVLTNTAVSQPADSAPPWLISAAGSRALLRTMTQRTDSFIRGGLRLSVPEPPADIRAAYLAPYDSVDRRDGVRAFVADIPLDEAHVSFETLETIANGLAQLGKVPALLLWGTKDPVFGEQYLHDLERRLPHARVHRFVGASHFVSEDAPVAEALWSWVGSEGGHTPTQSATFSPILPEVLTASPLVVEWNSEAGILARVSGRTSGGDWRSIEPAQFSARVQRLAAGLHKLGARPGDRVATMVPPGIDLTVVLYACWEAGLTAVLVDSGLGAKNMSAAIRAAAPDWLIGIPPAVVASKGLRWLGRRIVVGEMDSRLRRTLGVERSLREVEFAGEGLTVPDFRGSPARESAGTIVYTSGSTGPSKGVFYKAAPLGAQRNAIMDLYGITAADRLVAAFAPFALFGPAMGITSVVPNMDITKPGSLEAVALADAVGRVEATMVFASPAALENVVGTASMLSAAEADGLSRVRLVMSAGAPLRVDLLQQVAALFPGAEIHTPYGMTEVLPVADISLAVRLARGPGLGVCVGRPVEGLDVRVHAIGLDGQSVDSPADAGTFGEVVVRSGHLKSGYDRLWFTEHQATTRDGWHRTGDVGHLDDDGFLWISGRVQHVITHQSGPVPPIPFEHAAERASGVRRAAAVGIGPVGNQLVALVVEVDGRIKSPLVSHEFAAAVQEQILADGLQRPVAVLQTGRIPVDRRHNSKVDRTQVAKWAERVLAGDRPGRL